MADTIKLWRSAADPSLFNEGDYADDGNGAVWIFTCYSDDLCSPRCADDHCYLIHPSDCVICGNYITDWWHYLCQDGGESAHEDCVTIHSTYPHQTDNLHDCPACDMGDDDDR